jgi:hypothetical protein
MTDEKDRALCESHCNSAADEYFNARPQLDSSVNRRIFYAGHRKAWIERGEAVRLNATVPVGAIKRAIEALTYCEALTRHYGMTCAIRMHYLMRDKHAP